MHCRLLQQVPYFKKKVDSLGGDGLLKQLRSYLQNLVCLRKLFQMQVWSSHQIHSNSFAGK